MGLIQDPHLGLKFPEGATNVTLVQGNYLYYHYMCDGVDDRGWGCGYRTLQTICSWIHKQQNGSSVEVQVPAILDVQKFLVQMGDKSENFIGSRQWIGSVEIAYCIDFYYKVQCKIIHLKSRDDITKHSCDIFNHFRQFGSPVMMGGDKDCSSKCILGISETPRGTYLLILDPHFTGHASREKLQTSGWIKWHHTESLNQDSFYNLCCPLLKAAT